MTKAIRAVTLVLVLAVAAAACGSDATSGSDESSGDVAITKAWARTSPASAENGAAYMVLRSAEGDVLTKAAVDAAVAETVEIHETVKSMGGDNTTMAGSDSSKHSGMNEMMSMKPIDQLELPAGEDVALEPGGYHIMLLGLAEPLAEGETIELTLTFDKAGEKKVEVPVRSSAP